MMYAHACRRMTQQACTDADHGISHVWPALAAAVSMCHRTFSELLLGGHLTTAHEVIANGPSQEALLSCIFVADA